MAEVTITAAGFFSGGRFGNERESFTAPSGNLSDVRWGEISDAPFERFGRLDGVCKSAIVAVEMLGLEAVVEGSRSDWGITVGTEYGCVDVDVAFFKTRNQPGGASPILFPYTLPSTAIGEIAIRHRITGPNACYMAGRESGMLALREGARLVESGEASACICVGCDSIGGPASSEPMTEAWAFLIADHALSERAPLGRIVFEPAADGRRRVYGLREVFEVLASDDIKRSELTIQAPCALRGGPDMLIRHMR